MSTQKSHLPGICFFAIAFALRPLGLAGLVPGWGSLMNKFARPTLAPCSYNSAWSVGHVTPRGLTLWRILLNFVPSNQPYLLYKISPITMQVLN